jgi:hypothetical protein
MYASKGMGAKRRSLALIASITLLCGASLPGCFGYNRSAKRWAYVGDTALILGGGGVIALDVTSTEEPCTGNSCPYEAPITGAMVAGAVLVAAGLFGILFNVTRTNVKTSR